MAQKDNITVEIQGLDECLNAFKSLEGQLKKNANGDLRKASKAIALGIVGMFPTFANSTGAPQAGAIARAAGPKSDRYVVIAVPSKKPKLSGLKKTPADEAKRLGFAIEGGSDYPAFHNPQAGSLVQNHTAAMIAYAVPRYEAAVAELLRKYDLI